MTVETLLDTGFVAVNLLTGAAIAVPNIVGDWWKFFASVVRVTYDMVFLRDEPSGCPLTRCPALACCAGGEDDQTDGELLQDTHKSVNRKTGMLLSGLDYGRPHQPFKEEQRAGGLIPESAAAIDESAAAVRAEEVLGDLVQRTLALDNRCPSVNSIVARLHRAFLGAEPHGNTRLVARILAWIQAHDVLREGEGFLLPLVNEDCVLPLHAPAVYGASNLKVKGTSCPNI